MAATPSARRIRLGSGTARSSIASRPSRGDILSDVGGFGDDACFVSSFADNHAGIGGLNERRLR